MCVCVCVYREPLGGISKEMLYNRLISFPHTISDYSMHGMIFKRGRAYLTSLLSFLSCTRQIPLPIVYMTVDLTHSQPTAFPRDIQCHTSPIALGFHGHSGCKVVRIQKLSILVSEVKM